MTHFFQSPPRHNCDAETEAASKAKAGACTWVCTLQRKRVPALMRGQKPGGPTPTEGHSFCHSSKLFEAVKSRNATDDIITSAPPAALIEPFQIHVAFRESGTPANIYLQWHWPRKTGLGAEGGRRFLTLQHHCRCGRSLGAGLNLKKEIGTMERNQLKVEIDWIVIQSVPG